MMRSGVSILALFTAGIAGSWYDPSDLTTLFQDSAGTTPVTAAAQPVGLMLDKSQGPPGPQLITNGDFPVNVAGWSNSVLYPNGALSWEDGKLKITAITTGNIGAFQFFPVVAGKTYQLKVGEIGGTNASYMGRISGEGNTSVNLAAPAPNQIIFTAATSGDFYLTLRGLSKTAGTSVTFDSISVRELPGNHAVQATAAKRPTYQTSAGLHWLAFDGVDDAMATAAINFTGTDKVSVFAGVRNLSATVKMIVETGPNAPLDAGAFYLTCGADPAPANRYSSYSRGSVNSNQSAIGTTNVGDAPDTAVITALHDIAGDLSRLRRNGVVGANGTGDKGTGNFGNYIMNIGARNQTSLFFNGNLYGLIIPGKLASAAEIASTEAYMAGKTGVVL